MSYVNDLDIINEIENFNDNKTLKMELLDNEKFIRVNALKEVTNPVCFSRNSIPTSDGLLSNEIFGITKSDRSNTFAYIDLGEYFMHPLMYKIWGKLDSKVKDCVHGIKYFSLNDKGELTEDPDGETGVAFLKKNISKITIPRTSSNKRDLKIQFFEKNKNNPAIFWNKQVIIPAYYRDVNTENGKIGLGEINELYRSLLISIRALKGSSDYGLNLSYATRGRIQETILQIYNWFGQGTTINGKETTNVIPGKSGILHNAVLNKTTDYGSRLVLSAPELKVERLEDLNVTLDYTAVPLASVCVNFFPYIMFYVRRFFENEFSSNQLYPVYDSANRKVKYVEIENYQTEFSDEHIQKQINRFISGYSNRFIPIEIPTKTKERYAMVFKGYSTTPEQIANKIPTTELSLVEREMCWVDLFFMAASEATKDKHILITRYPIDTCYNQFPTRVNVSSTKQTEPVIMGGKVYRNYPKIRQEDIGTNTSNKFIDTLNLCNCYLSGIGGDYDGDQVTVKGVYGAEANEELDGFLNSKSNYINFGASGLRNSSNEAVQCLYNLTLVLPDDKSKIEAPVF